jgi:hypothetical protein
MAAASGRVKRLVQAGVLREVTGRKGDQNFIAPGRAEDGRARPLSLWFHQTVNCSLAVHWTGSAGC